MSSTWYSTFTGDFPVGAIYDAQIQAIVDDLTDNLVTDPDGKTVLDVNAFITLATERIAAIDAPVDPYRWLLDGPYATNIRPLIEKLSKDLAKVSGSSLDTIVDLQPLLSDCEAKSKAVTDYFTKLYDVILPDQLDAAMESGSLDKNVPPLDDLSKETRFYIATFVNDWENESKPSLPSTILEVGLKDTVTIDRPTVPDARDLAHWRLYRSNSGSQGAAFQYVPYASDVLGIPVATASLLDEVKNSELQEVCPSLIWDEPLGTLSGIVAQDNGIHVGFIGRTLYPSENFTPFAFPNDYRKTIPEEIVALLGLDGMTFVATRGRPHFLIGNEAASMRAVDTKSSQACVSPRSLCETPMGPVYASPDGLCLAAPEQVVRVLTADLFTREEWQALGPQNMMVRYHDGVIYIMRDAAAAAAPTYVWDTGFAQAATTFSGTGGVTWARSNTVALSAVNRVRASRSSGKWYAEVKPQWVGAPGNTTLWGFGVCDETSLNTMGFPAVSDNAVGYHNNTFIVNENVVVASGATYTAGDVMGVALNASTGEVKFFKNNVLQATVTLAPGHSFYLYTSIDRQLDKKWTLHRDYDSTMVYAPPSGYQYWG